MKCATPPLRGLILLACGCGHEGDTASSEEARLRCQRVVGSCVSQKHEPAQWWPSEHRTMPYGSRITLDGNFVVRASTSESVGHTLVALFFVSSRTCPALLVLVWTTAVLSVPRQLHGVSFDHLC